MQRTLTDLILTGGDVAGCSWSYAAHGCAAGSHRPETQFDGRVPQTPQAAALRASENPAEVKWPAGHDPSMSTDPLTGAFPGWQAVENAALALAESANLLMIPGAKLLQRRARSDQGPRLGRVRAAGA